MRTRERQYRKRPRSHLLSSLLPHQLLLGMGNQVSTDKQLRVHWKPLEKDMKVTPYHLCARQSKFHNTETPGTDPYCNQE